MNRNRLIILAVIMLAFFIIVKTDWRPNIDRDKIQKEATDTSAAYTVKHTDGVEKSYFSNGSLRSETPYVNGVRHGKAFNYYANGNLRSEINYVNGKQEGETKTYYKNGKLEKVYTYADDMLNGPAKSYDEEGYLFSVTTFLNNVQHDKETGY